MGAAQRGAHVRGDRTAGAPVRRALPGRRPAPHRRRAHDARTLAGAGAQAGSVGCRSVDDHQRLHLAAHGARVARCRPAAAQHQPRHVGAREVPADDQARRARARARRHRGRQGGRVRAGEGERGGGAWGQRRRDRRPRPLRPRARGGGAVHRVHAARRRRSLAQREGLRPGRNRGRDPRGVPAAAGACPRRGAGCSGNTRSGSARSSWE